MGKKTIGKQNYVISTDKSKLDLNIIHTFLAIESYWCRNIPLKTVKRSIEHSLCFGMYCEGAQIGFARVITDYASTAYLSDVFILKEFRGKGLSKWLVKYIMEHNDLQGLRRWVLVTADAQGLYSQLGWKPLASPEKYMEIHNKEVYSI
jgi:GNAT superfamily N-acetyltransferase